MRIAEEERRVTNLEAVYGHLRTIFDRAMEYRLPRDIKKVRENIATYGVLSNAPTT